MGGGDYLPRSPKASDFRFSEASVYSTNHMSSSVQSVPVGTCNGGSKGTKIAFIERRSKSASSLTENTKKQAAASVPTNVTPDLSVVTCFPELEDDVFFEVTDETFREKSVETCRSAYNFQLGLLLHREQLKAQRPPKAVVRSHT